MAAGPGSSAKLQTSRWLTVPVAHSEGVATPSEYPNSIKQFGLLEHARWLQQRQLLQTEEFLATAHPASSRRLPTTQKFLYCSCSSGTTHGDHTTTHHTSAEKHPTKVYLVLQQMMENQGVGCPSWMSLELG